MRALVQRGASAKVEVENQVGGSIGPGLLILAGFENGYGDEDLA